MDKLIAKVKGDVSKGDKKKSLKDIKTLQKADRKFDKEIREAKQMKKKGMRGC